MVIQDQHRPVLATALHLSTDLLLPGLKPHHGLAALGSPAAGFIMVK
jgi:hypothetical protein